jgi:hypothetical protein
MNLIPKDLGRRQSTQPQCATIQTTLYDLVGAISEKIPPEKDFMISGIVTHLLTKGKAKFVTAGGEKKIIQGPCNLTLPVRERENRDH